MRKAALALLALAPMQAAGEPVALCSGLRSISGRVDRSVLPEVREDGLAVARHRDGLLVWSEDADAVLSASLGILLEDRTGRICRVALQGTEDPASALIVGRYANRTALEAGLCSKASGTCTPVRVTLPPATPRRGRAA